MRTTLLELLFSFFFELYDRQKERKGVQYRDGVTIVQPPKGLQKKSQKDKKTTLSTLIQLDCFYHLSIKTSCIAL